MRYIHRNEWLVYGLLAVTVLVVSLPLYPYRWHMFLHIAGVVVFLGNIFVTAAWMLLGRADAQHDGHTLLCEGGYSR